MKSLCEHIWSKWWQLIGSRDSTIHLVAGVNELTNELFLLLIRHRSLTRICLFITRVLFERCMNYVISFKWQELEESGHEPDIRNERHSQSQRLPLYKLSSLSKGLRFRLQTFAQLARWTHSSPGLWMACPRGMTITFNLIVHWKNDLFCGPGNGNWGVIYCSGIEYRVSQFLLTKSLFCIRSPRLMAIAKRNVCRERVCDSRMNNEAFLMHFAR